MRGADEWRELGGSQGEGLQEHGGPPTIPYFQSMCLCTSVTKRSRGFDAEDLCFTGHSLPRCCLDSGELYQNGTL